jgi:hypothetical protein
MCFSPYFDNFCPTPILRHLASGTADRVCHIQMLGTRSRGGVCICGTPRSREEGVGRRSDADNRKGGYHTYKTRHRKLTASVACRCRGYVAAKELSNLISLQEAAVHMLSIIPSMFIPLFYHNPYHALWTLYGGEASFLIRRSTASILAMIQGQGCIALGFWLAQLIL